jgi:hypothetical protein
MAKFLFGFIWFNRQIEPQEKPDINFHEYTSLDLQYQLRKKNLIRVY